MLLGGWRAGAPLVPFIPQIMLSEELPKTFVPFFFPKVALAPLSPP